MFIYENQQEFDNQEKVTEWVQDQLPLFVPEGQRGQHECKSQS